MTKHPFQQAATISVTRHANGVALYPYDMRRDSCSPSENVHVFTSFEEMTEFLKGWWPEAK